MGTLGASFISTFWPRAMPLMTMELFPSMALPAMERFVSVFRLPAVMG